MTRQLTNYFTGLAVCVAIAGAYLLLLAPWVEPPRIETSPLLASARSGISDLPAWAQLFGEGAWQNTAPKQLVTDRGVLLFQNWERQENDRWQLKPVTLLLNASNTGGKLDGRTIILDAPEGAEIRFAEAITVLDGTTPILSGGQLRGKVRIYSPASEADNSDALDIRASNVRIDGGSIYTGDTVLVRLGTAEAAGRDLTIELAASPRLGGGADTPWKTLDRLELVYLDHLTVHLPEGGLWEPSREPLPMPLPPVASGEQGAKLAVRCQGSLEFDFASSTLSLSDNVVLSHKLPQVPEDTIRCDTLRIGVADPSTVTADAEPYKFIRSIQARGKPLDIRLPSLAAGGTAETFTYDLASGLVQLLGQQPVRIRYGGVDITVPRIDYAFDTKNPQEFGNLTISGAGRIDNHDPQMQFKTIQWSRGLGLLPERDRHVFWMSGDTRLDLADGGSVEADKVQAALSGLMPAAGVSDAAAAPAADGVQVDQLIARGNVRIDIPQVLVETGDAEVWFDYEKTDEQPQDGAPLLTRPDGNNLRSWVAEPTGPAASQEERPRPEIRGKLLHAQLRLSNKALAAADLSLRQDVQLRYKLLTDTGAMPVTIHGDQLRLIETNHPSDRIQVNGAPARVELADGYLKAPLVNVLTRQDTLSIDRAGSLQLPSMLLEQFGDAGSQWHFDSPPLCRWGTSLTFDGTTLRADGGVDLQTTATSRETAQQWNVNGRAGQLEVTLSGRVRLREPGSNNPSIERISLKDNVLFNANQLGEREIAARHVIQLPQLDLYPMTGAIAGAGPGDYRMWANRNEESGDRFVGSMLGDSPFIAGNLIYRSHLEGNIHEGRIDFHHGVRLAMSPVADLNQSVDAIRLTEPGPNQARIDCERLRLLRVPDGHRGLPTDPAATPWEISAMGGVTFIARNETDRFSGQAARFGYAMQKDLLTIEGDDSIPAVFDRTLQSGVPGGHWRGTHIWVRPRDMSVVKMHVGNISAGDLQQGYGIPAPQQADGALRSRF